MEPSDLDLSPFKDRGSFRDAAADYDRSAGRAYDEAVKKGTKLEDLSSRKLVTPSKRPLIIGVDTTGSMGEAPATMFGKFPLLELGIREYLGEDTEVSYCSIGDASSEGRFLEDFPLQFRPFAKGVQLEKELKALVPEGKGGGTGQESYEQAALYYARQITMPEDAKPIVIFIGDEMPYSITRADQARKFGFMDINKDIPTAEVFRELRQRNSVYLIRRRYGDVGGGMDAQINEEWVRYLGRDRIAKLLSDERVVDIAFGIFARETGRIPYFWQEVTERQTPQQVDLIERCLEPVIGRRRFDNGYGARNTSSPLI